MLTYILGVVALLKACDVTNSSRHDAILAAILFTKN